MEDNERRYFAASVPVTVKGPALVPIDLKAIAALTENQRQLDEDGIEVGVSRQALDMLLVSYANGVLAALSPPAGGQGGAVPADQPGGPCVGDNCGRRDGIKCADHECDIISGVYPPPADAVGVETGWQSMDSAPKDGTMLRLLVQPSTEPNDGWTPFADSSDPYSTIGFNALSDTLEDEWQFAGWDWCHDCFTDGAGEVIGWMPIAPVPARALPDSSAAAGEPVAVGYIPNPLPATPVPSTAPDSGEKAVAAREHIERADIASILSKQSPEGLSPEEKLIWILGDLMNAVENYFGAENPKRLGHIYAAACRILDEVPAALAAPPPAAPLVEALEFYAQRGKGWKYETDYFAEGEIIRDEGDIDRAALAAHGRDLIHGDDKK